MKSWIYENGILHLGLYEFVLNENKIWVNMFIENLARDIKLTFSNFTGYSMCNLKYMAKSASEYPNIKFVQRVVAQIL